MANHSFVVLRASELGRIDGYNETIRIPCGLRNPKNEQKMILKIFNCKSFNSKVKNNISIHIMKFI